MELDELYGTVQPRVDSVQKWSVQMYWTRVGGRSVTSRQILTTYGRNTPRAPCASGCACVVCVAMQYIYGKRS